MKVPRRSVHVPESPVARWMLLASLHAIVGLAVLHVLFAAVWGLLGVAGRQAELDAIADLLRPLVGVVGLVFPHFGATGMDGVLGRSIYPGLYAEFIVCGWLQALLMMPLTLWGILENLPFLGRRKWLNATLLLGAGLMFGTRLFLFANQVGMGHRTDAYHDQTIPYTLFSSFAVTFDAWCSSYVLIYFILGGARCLRNKFSILFE